MRTRHQPDFNRGARQQRMGLIVRRLVHAQLERMEIVAGFRLAGSDGGEWGATLVSLRSPQEHQANRKNQA